MTNEEQNALFDMVMQSESYRSLPERLKTAWENWSTACTDDFDHATRFDLTLGEEIDLINWMSHRRDYVRLCNEMEESQASDQARSNLSVLRGDWSAYLDKLDMRFVPLSHLVRQKALKAS